MLGSTTLLNSCLQGGAAEATSRPSNNPLTPTKWKTPGKNVPKEDLDAEKKPKSKKKEKSLPKTMEINDAHNIWGHEGFDLLNKTAKRYGITLTGTLLIQCKRCGRANTKQKDI